MGLTFSDETMQRIIASAIIGELTPGAREELLTKAVEGILSEKTGNGYNSPTRIQAAFARAVDAVAVEIATDELRKPENMAKLRSVVVTAVEQAIGATADDYDSVVGKLAAVCKQHFDNLVWTDYEATEAEVMADPVARAAAMQNRAERAEAQLRRLAEMAIAFCVDLSDGVIIYRSDMQAWVDRQLMAELIEAAKAARSAGEES
jgi:hypothetical protein